MATSGHTSSIRRLSLELNTVLFICDVQDSFRLNIDGFYPMLKEILRLIETAKLLKLPIVVSEHDPPQYGNLVNAIKDKLPEQNVHFIQKKSFSMITKELSELVKKHEWKNIILVGVETHVCVMMTAFDLIEMNCNVFPVVNAVGSRVAIDKQYGLSRMQEAGSGLVTSEMVMMEVLNGTDHPLYDKVEKLISLYDPPYAPE